MNNKIDNKKTKRNEDGIFSVKCKLCREHNKLVKSHVIPESFFRDISTLNDFKQIDNKGTYPKRMPTGVYEKIICDDCEKSFGDGDGYIKEFFRQNSHLIKKDNIYGYTYKDFKIDKINKFVLSLLWRASVSSHNCFEAVCLGNKYEEQIRGFLSGSTLPVTFDFS